MACVDGVKGDEDDLVQGRNTFESSGRATIPALDPRSYQIEMFEASMKENVIVVMATGSGKTMVARLRIEAELQRTPTKARVLCNHHLDDATLMNELPSYSFRLITGADSVQFWSTQTVWDSALAGQQGIISTPEVLRAALEHGFVSLADISLLIFDEAHHCMKNHPTNLIMKQWYHSPKLSATCNRPAILGLTASPIARNIGAMQELERNLGAVCRTPTLNLEDYRSFVHMPQMLPLAFNQYPTQSSRLLSVLSELVDGYNILTDPLYIRFSQSTSLSDKVRLDKIIQKNETPILADLKRLYNQAGHLETQIGQVQVQHLSTPRSPETIHLLGLLSSIPVSIPNPTPPNPIGDNVSGKALALIRYLAENRASDATCIIFVERRATAWALRELVASLDQLSFWKPFALVGISSTQGQGLADLVDQQMPSTSLEDFREGALNLCIATSVLEEGIDVQACNLVICFDDSPNVKSFIQRRGRARRPGSKYVILQDSGSLAQSSKYQALEDQMIAAYADLDRQISSINQLERIDEVSDLHYHVPSTGAYLTIDQARAHLAHFCNLLPHREGRQMPAPIYIMDGYPGEEVSCRIEGRQSFYDTAPIVNPWASNEHKINSLYRHRLRIQHSEINLPPLLLLLPIPLRHQLLVTLFGTTVASATVSFIPREEESEYEQSSANEATKLLFSSALQRRLGAIDLDKVVMPYYVIPDIPARSIESWIESAKFSCPAQMFDIRAKSEASYLIRKQGISSAYIYKVSEHSGDGMMVSSEMSPELDLLRISRQMNFLSSTEKALPPVRRVHDTADCWVIGLQPEYAIGMTYIPSIMHVVEIAMRAHLARIGPLKSLGLGAGDEAVLASALTAPGVAQTDYQRLEFIGDSLLKYWTSVHMFCLNPNMPENLLTDACHRLVNNARLQQATRDLGLDAYFSNMPFSARKWSLVQKPEFGGPRVISSKTLADVIEALIGVAYADFGNAPLDVNSLRIQRALSLFLPTVPWQIPPTLIKEQKATSTGTDLAGCLNIPDSDQFNSIESILGYSFANKATLLTALTHSTAQIGLQTYERLEFLGDAIIDIIVKQKLWHSPLQLSEGQMTSRHASLVNKDMFAYLTTKLTLEKGINEVNVDPNTKQVHLAEKRRRICLHDFMSKLPDREFMDKRERFMKRFEEIQEKLEQELSIVLFEEKELGRFVGASCKAEAENMAAQIVLEKIAFGEVGIVQKTRRLVIKEHGQEQGNEDPICTNLQESDEVESDVS
ncbi:hypothetical protein DV738_g2937, partial [Chaetothyriales sp. CBS 135597]